MSLFYEIFSEEFFFLHLAFVFLFGSLWGSFFGLCIARIPAGQSIVFPNSYCFSCGKLLRWNDNIPLYSYWALGGRCHWCGTAFSSRHFWIELLSGALFAWVFLARGYTPTIVLSWVFTGLLVIATFTDLDHWIIPDQVSLGGAAIGIAAALIPFPDGWEMRSILGVETFVRDHTILRAGPFSAEQRAWWTAAANAACGAGFGYGVLWLVGKIGSLMFRKEAMGGGDIKLFAAIGAFLGIVNCLYVLFLSSLLGASFGIASLIASRWRGGAGRASEEMGEADAESLTARAMEYIYPDETPTDDSERTRDRAALLNLLTQPPPSRTMRRHLPFGPYLAMASFLVMLYQPYFDAFVQRYLGLFGAL